MHSLFFTLIYCFYGLAFFCMGLVTMLEVPRCSDARLRHALRYLAVFGLLHGTHEWLVMLSGLGSWQVKPDIDTIWAGVRLALLVLSFISLGAFGALLLSPNESYRRLALLVPLALTSLWAFGAFILRGHYGLHGGLIPAVDVWARYSMAIPASLLASIGLIAQQREFRRAGMAEFGRDTLWAAIAFAWYGLVGQLFATPSPLPPSTFLNSNLFYDVFGFPIELIRACTAIIVAVFVIRFLRAFEVEAEHMIAELQIARLEEAQRREALRGELLRRVVAAQEAERQRIARELHDETGQSLTALGLGLRGVSTLLRQDDCLESAPLTEKATGNLRQLENMVARSLDDLQRLIADLRPSHLDDLGLPAALRWYCNDLQNRLPLQIHVDILGEPRELPAEVKTTLFRVTQEALTNVARHSHAKVASVRLDFGNEVVRLNVEDDGCGFDLSRLQNAKRPSWGLLGMEERAALLGGHLEIYSRPGLGTRVEVTIPYLQKPAPVDQTELAL